MEHFARLSLAMPLRQTGAISFEARTFEADAPVASG
jgi:hypothetical protein